MADAQTQAGLTCHSPEDGLGEGLWLFTRGRLDEIKSMILVVRPSKPVYVMCHDPLLGLHRYTLLPSLPRSLLLIGGSTR